MIVDFDAMHAACSPKFESQNDAKRAHERKQHREQYWANGALVDDSDNQ